MVFVFHEYQRHLLLSQYKSNKVKFNIIQVCGGIDALVKLPLH